MADPRQTRRYRKLRAQVLLEEPLCGLKLPGICTVVSTTAGHIKSVKDYPELAMRRDNLRGECWPCNKAKGELPDELLNLDHLNGDDGEPEALGIFE